MGAENLKLVLASASPRRAELLRRAGLEFEVAPSRIEEREVPHLSPAELSLWLAKQKAEDVARQRPDAVVLAADTVVALGRRVFGKPGSEPEAVAMLKALSGRSHWVHTGVWIVSVKGGLRRGFVASSEVIFHRLSQARIARYLSEVNPLDKAGGYAAQQDGQRIIREIRGSRSNVVGLPMEKTLEMLRAVFWQQ